MKVKVIAGKIYLPKKLREKLNLKEKSECEVLVVGNEIRLIPVQPKSLNTLKYLTQQREAGIEEMVEAEVVEDA